MPDLELAQSIDPRAGYLQTAPEGLEYRVATPLWGPFYQQSPWMWNDLPVESFYNPRSAPYGQPNPYIPQRSGAFIQPGQADPLAYALVSEGNPLAAYLPTKIQPGALALGAISALFVYAFTKRWKTALIAGLVMGGLKAADPGTMGQGELDWHPEDPTGGAYEGGGDPIYGDPLGPGENIAVASQYFGTLKPRGFAAQSKA